MQLSSSEPFQLKCESSTVPPPVVTWWKDDRELPVMEGLEVEGDTLYFEAPDEQLHSGYYHCLATNSMGVAKSQVRLLAAQANIQSYKNCRLSLNR